MHELCLATLMMAETQHVIRYCGITLLVTWRAVHGKNVHTTNSICNKQILPIQMCPSHNQ